MHCSAGGGVGWSRWYYRWRNGGGSIVGGGGGLVAVVLLAVTGIPRKLCEVNPN